jgi:hypothetical protein
MSAQAPKKTAGSRRLLLAEPAIWLVIAAGMWVYSYRFDQELSSYALGPLIYAWLLPRAGYYIATPVFIATYMSILGVSRWRTIALTTIAAYAALLLVFTRLLYIPLPTGNWPGFYDFSNWLLVLLRA